MHSSGRPLQSPCKKNCVLSRSLVPAQVGTLVTANQPAQENRAEVLTLTGWSALGAAFALVTLVLLGAVFAVRRFSGARNEGKVYQMVMKKPAAGQVELQ